LITPEEVEKAKGTWELRLRMFLIQRGWSVSNGEWGQWSKGESCLLTDEEAFWKETEG